MRKIKTTLTSLFVGALALTGCGTTGGDLGSQLLSGVLGSTGTGATEAANTAINAGTLISGIVGQLTQNTSESSIVGTWVYQEPSIQFESENFLAQAGGAVASSALIKKLEPYYKKIGITPGKFSFTFNKDKTCSYTMGGNTYSGTYTYDSSKHTITISGQIITFPSAYVTVSANNLALTFDSSKILTMAQGFAGASQNATLSTLSSLTSSFKGMKTGFLFKKQ